MGLFDFITKRRAEPVREVADPTLGRLVWSSDEDGWVGRLGDTDFSIARGDGPEPSPELLAYVREVLADTAWLATCLAQAKRTAKAQYEAFYHAEIDTLRYESFGFYLRRHRPAIIADLGERDRGRSWRIEFLDRVCEGIGFDT
jgi:hypothetical protein